VGIFPVISPAIDRLAGVFTGVNGNVFG